MFRILLKLSAIGQIAGQILLLVFLIALFLPLFPALGLELGPNPGNANAKHFQALSQASVYMPAIMGLLISFITGYSVVVLALITGFFTRHTYPGKFAILAVISLLVFLPDFLSFMNGTSWLAMVAGKKSVLLFTHASGFVWGFALALLFSYAYLERMNSVEVEITISLGGNQANILFQYLLPRSKNFIVNLGAFLSTSFFAQGFYTYYSASNKSETLYHKVLEPMRMYGDAGPGSAIYLIFLLIALTGTFFLIKYANLEYADRKTPKAAKSKAKKSKKRVTRRPAPKAKKEKKKKKSKKGEEAPSEADSMDGAEQAVSEEGAPVEESSSVSEFDAAAKTSSPEETAPTESTEQNTPENTETNDSPEEEAPKEPAQEESKEESPEEETKTEETKS